MAIRGTFSVEKAFRLVTCYDAISWDDLDAMLGVPVGCGMAMVLVRLLGRCTMGWAMGRTMGYATTGTLVAMPAGRLAGVASMMLALVSLGSVVTSAWSLFASLSSSQFAECSEMI